MSHPTMIEQQRAEYLARSLSDPPATNLVVEGRANEIMAVLQRLRKQRDLALDQWVDTSLSTSNWLVAQACYEYEARIKERCQINTLYKPNEALNSEHNPYLIGRPLRDTLDIYISDIDGRLTTKAIPVIVSFWTE